MFPDGRVYHGSFLDGVTGNVKECDIVSSGTASTVVFDMDNLSTQVEIDFAVEDAMESIIGTIEHLSMDDLTACFDDDDDMMCTD